MSSNLYSALQAETTRDGTMAARDPEPLSRTLPKPACPLCGEGGQDVREKIATADICRLYCDQLGVDVSPYFARIDTLELMHCPGCGLGHFSPPVTGDGPFYDRLQNAPWYYLESKYEYEFVANLVVPGAAVLDIGSGEGRFAHLLPSGTGYTGLDMSAAAVRKAAEQGVRVINEPVERHAIANAGRYDVVVSFQSAEHVAEPRSFLAAAARCVMPGGRLVVAVPSEDSFLRYASNSPLNLPPHHVTRWTDAALHGAGRVIGMRLAVLHHEPLQDIHRDWALAVMANALLGRGRRQIERNPGIVSKIRARLASRLGRMLHKRLPPELSPAGHTVIAIYTN